jgi:hypothetical protein
MACRPMTTQIKNDPFEVSFRVRIRSLFCQSGEHSGLVEEACQMEEDGIRDRSGGRARERAGSDQWRTAVTRGRSHNILTSEARGSSWEALSTKHTQAPKKADN